MPDFSGIYVDEQSYEFLGNCPRATDIAEFSIRD
jgi:hypothetical protein